MAKSMYYLGYGAAKAVYFVGENWLSDWLDNYI